MKEVTITARNLYYVRDAEGKYQPQVEAILVVSEPSYRVDAAGGVVKERVLDVIRFSTNPDGLRRMAENFIEWANDAEEEVASASNGDSTITEASSDASLS